MHLFFYSLKRGVMKERPDLPNYKDLWFRGVACLLAAHYIVMMGWPGQTTFKAFMDPTYYPTLIINYAIALVVGLAVKNVTLVLDKRFRWYDDIWRRAMLQFALGVAAVSILSFFLVWIYFVSFNQDIVSSGYLNYELPFSIALIAILNLYYVAYYFYTYPRPLFKEIEEPVLLPIVMENERYEIEPVEEINTEMLIENGVEPVPKKREILIVEAPGRSIPVRVADIAMFFILDKTVFIRLKSMKSLNECYPFEMKLYDIMDVLEEREFFRINRQCIINFAVIGELIPLGGEKGTLLTLKPEIGPLEDIGEGSDKKIYTVPFDKTVEFKDWMNR